MSSNPEGSKAKRKQNVESKNKWEQSHKHQREQARKDKNARENLSKDALALYEGGYTAPEDLARYSNAARAECHAFKENKLRRQEDSVKDMDKNARLRHNQDNSTNRKRITAHCLRDCGETGVKLLKYPGRPKDGGPKTFFADVSEAEQDKFYRWFLSQPESDNVDRLYPFYWDLCREFDKLGGPGGPSDFMPMDLDEDEDTTGQVLYHHHHIRHHHHHSSADTKGKGVATGGGGGGGGIGNKREALESPEHDNDRSAPAPASAAAPVRADLSQEVPIGYIERYKHRGKRLVPFFKTTEHGYVYADFNKVSPSTGEPPALARCNFDFNDEEKKVGWAVDPMSTKEFPDNLVKIFCRMRDGGTRPAFYFGINENLQYHYVKDTDRIPFGW